MSGTFHAGPLGWHSGKRGKGIALRTPQRRFHLRLISTYKAIL